MEIVEPTLGEDELDSPLVEDELDSPLIVEFVLKEEVDSAVFEDEEALAVIEAALVEDELAGVEAALVEVELDNPFVEDLVVDLERLVDAARDFVVAEAALHDDELDPLVLDLVPEEEGDVEVLIDEDDWEVVEAALVDDELDGAFVVGFVVEEDVTSLVVYTALEDAVDLSEDDEELADVGRKNTVVDI